MAQQGADAVRDGSKMLRDNATRLGDSTTRYIQEEPLKAVLIAAAAGAALVGLVSLLSRSNHRH
jgi:ElaB/YqjD/DUF883 family membrane-anchored ribosome-binding protein